MSEVVVSDWFEGDDPGMNLFAVRTPSGNIIINSDVTSWTLVAIDLTADPTTEITPTANGSNAVLNTFFAATSAAMIVDGYWTKNDIGYNIRHYIRDSDFSPSLKAGHFYRFVYRIQTAPFDGTANKCGQITLMREGTCRPRGG